MDRINYPTQESVIVGCGNTYPFYQTNTEVGIYGVLVRLVTQLSLYQLQVAIDIKYSSTYLIVVIDKENYGF